MSPINEEPASVSSHATSEAQSVPIPGDALIIVPVRNMVLFPGVVAPVTIGRPKSIAAAQQALREQRPIGILLQRDAEVSDPGPDDLNRICTVANIVRTLPGRMKVTTSSAKGFNVHAFLTSFPALHFW